jgi:hypothetical protein
MPASVAAEGRATCITGIAPWNHAPNTASALTQVVIRRFRPALQEFVRLRRLSAST